MLVPLVVVAVAIASNDDDEPAASTHAAATPAHGQHGSDLQGQAQVRNKEQVQALTDRMRAMAASLGPVLSGFATTLPPDEQQVGRLASAAGVNGWMWRVKDADAFFEDTKSGETGTNVAFGAFSAATDTLLEATRTYRLALDEPEARRALLERGAGSARPGSSYVVGGSAPARRDQCRRGLLAPARLPQRLPVVAPCRARGPRAGNRRVPGRAVCLGLPGHPEPVPCDGCPPLSRVFSATVFSC